MIHLDIIRIIIPKRPSDREGGVAGRALPVVCGMRCGEKGPWSKVKMPYISRRVIIAGTLGDLKEWNRQLSAKNMMLLQDTCIHTYIHTNMLWSCCILQKCRNEKDTHTEREREDV
jgi:hypothetical protein